MNAFSDDFSFDFYKRICDISKSIGSIVSMADYEKKLDKEGCFFIWRHNLYKASYDLLFEKEILKHFEIYGQFTNTKRGIGISCKKHNS
ncbi:hypothetical protein N8516_06410 [Candidatus Thioglobus sp.]|nr:hypothetical protein [Candidatus Thioglobus sp.]